MASSYLRKAKNVVNNFTEAEILVREATSNDPWGPEMKIMDEIAEMTNNQVSFTEIMGMIWKRLNDHGKNWRHVYKSLILLETLIKIGSERVTKQCRDNIYAIETLKNFNYTEKDGQDNGKHIREKSAKLVALLNDEHFLEAERVKARTAKARLKEAHGVGSGYSHTKTSFSKSSKPRTNNSEVESSRPQTIGEEDLQLQLALEMSKAEAESQNKESTQEDLRLKMAIEESLKGEKQPEVAKKNQSSLLDLDFNLTQTQVQAQPQVQNTTPTPVSQVADPFAAAPGPVPTSTAPVDPFGLGFPMGGQPPVTNSADPWGNSTPATQTAPIQQVNDPWGTTTQQPVQENGFSDPFGMSGMKQETTNIQNNMTDPFTSGPEPITNQNQPNASLSHTFLGGLGADLVNLDSLGSTSQPVAGTHVRGPSPTNQSNNPFAGVQQNTGNIFSGNVNTNNPFATNAIGPSLNQLKTDQTTQQDNMNAAFAGIMQPANRSNNANPFF